MGLAVMNQVTTCANDKGLIILRKCFLALMLSKASAVQTRPVWRASVEWAGMGRSAGAGGTSRPYSALSGAQMPLVAGRHAARPSGDGTGGTSD